MRPLLVTSLLLVSPLAVANTLKQAAVDQFKGDAQTALSAAKQKAIGYRQQASDRPGILGVKTQDIRGGIAKTLRKSRKEMHGIKLTIADVQQQHGTAKQTVEATGEALKTSEQTVAASKGKLSWLARNLRFAITKSGRANLRQYRADRSAHAALESRSKEEKEALEQLGDKLASFEADLGHVSERIVDQRARNIGHEAESATNAEIAKLERSAVEVEDAARSSIRQMVTGWVKGQTAGQRNPIEVAKSAAHKAVQLGEEADSKIATAQNKIQQAKDTEAANAIGDGLELLLGGKNDTADALFKLGRAVGDVSSTWSAQDAQSWIKSANHAVESFQKQVSHVSGLSGAIQHGAAGIDGQASRVRANVTLVSYVDLVVNLTRFDSALSDLAAGGVQSIQLARAGNQLDKMRGDVDRMRQQVKALHAALGESLHALDQKTAAIIDEAVKELVDG
jgi:hypothetical protein